MSALIPSPAGQPPPVLSTRGTVEGFYGPPWPHAERMSHLEFSARVGLNAYVYAPKNDPYHRARWRHRYPAPDLARLAELAETARTLGIRFTYAISPGLSMRFAEEVDYQALAAKAAQLHDAGVDSFALFFDDVPAELTRPEEVDRWPGAGAAGAAHGETCTRFVAEFLTPRGIREPLLVCPTDYAGVEETAYRRRFAATAPPDIVVAWTGHDIVVGEVSRSDIDKAAASYQRRLMLWDNFPVNDFEPSRLFLGPLTGRTTELAGSPLAGVLANPMIQAVPSRIPLMSVADWARDPDGYDPAASARRALDAAAGAGAEHLAPLVGVCGSWPPSAEPDAELARAVADTLAGRPGAAGVLTGRLTGLARACRAAAEPEPLVAALRPWLVAGADMAAAGLAAVRLLDTATADAVEETRRALARAESHYADVLRVVVPPFVREVLDRTGQPDPGPAGQAERDAAGRPARAKGRPVALLVTGERRTAGDEAVAALLGERGYAVCRRHAPGPDEVAAASLVVVTRGADGPAIEAVAHAGAPLLAWHGLVPLGLARHSEVLLARDRVRIVDPADPAAAGLADVVSVYRGPAKLTVAEVGPDAQIVALVVDENRPALFRYPRGARLPDGTVAPAPRVGVFLGADGLAPWLMTADGRALVVAALDACAARGRPAPDAGERPDAVATGPAANRQRGASQPEDLPRVPEVSL
ncbi:beta-N-acetylglucosaminidase domain-containing protein [Micromonospora sp. LOL_025]|uniref:beta-N-acetylglucosaminidase domain-containing protein n=1 Tax=Micromonospora sp. LOL_025 TaxID=3345413 RepID=UPI003A839D15